MGPEFPWIVATVVVGVVAGVAAWAIIWPNFVTAAEGKKATGILSQISTRIGAAPDILETTTRWRCGIYDYPPLSRYPAGRTSQPSGPLVYLAREVMDRVGRLPVYSKFSYEDFYRNDRQLPDVVVGMFETPLRSQTMRFTQPLYKIGLQGICRVGFKGDMLERLRSRDLKAAVYIGEVGWEYLRRHFDDVFDSDQIVKIGGGHQLDTMSHLATAVDENGYEVVIMDELSCEIFLREGNHRKEFKLAFPHSLLDFEACIAVRPDHEHMIPELNKAIWSIRTSAEYRELEDAALDGFGGTVERLG